MVAHEEQLSLALGVAIGPIPSDKSNSRKNRAPVSTSNHSLSDIPPFFSGDDSLLVGCSWPLLPFCFGVSLFPVVPVVYYCVFFVSRSGKSFTLRFSMLPLSRAAAVIPQSTNLSFTLVKLLVRLLGPNPDSGDVAVLISG